MICPVDWWQAMLTRMSGEEKIELLGAYGYNSGPIDEQYARQVNAMTDHQRAEMVLQLVGDDTDFEDSRKFKLFALELAETLGPDLCIT